VRANRSITQEKFKKNLQKQSGGTADLPEVQKKKKTLMNKQVCSKKKRRHDGSTAEHRTRDKREKCGDAASKRLGKTETAAE